MAKYNNHLKVALELTRIAEREIPPRFQSVTVDHKTDGTEVTEADRSAKVAMRAAIQKQYPSHGIIGEEGDDVNPESRWQWILDPIDGTTWFALGLPRFGTLVALLEQGEPVLGVIHLPEAFVSSSGVHSSEIQPVEGHVPIHLSPVICTAKKFRFIGDCIQHMMVARGKIHAAVDTIMAPWDTAAIIPCIREAGGVASTTRGDTANVVFGGSLVTAGHPQLHNQLLDTLSSEERQTQ